MALAWAAFPTEIRLMILSIIAYQKTPGWASLASVCKECRSTIQVHMLLITRSPSVRISSMVSNAIMKLFRILSTWRLAKNLALEINVYSPSDYEHWFKHIYVCSDDVEHNGDTNRARFCIMM